MPDLHSKFGFSAVSTYEQCPYRYKLQYIEGLKVIDSDDPANPLIIGSAMHKGIETDVETAVEEYYSHYPIITDLHVHEEMKLRYLIPKVKELIPDDATHEVLIQQRNFIGTIDLLVQNYDMTYDLYDFKYSNNITRYGHSRQLHLYKYYLEKTKGIKIKNLKYLFIPKVQIRQKKTESLLEFRQRLMKELAKVEPTIIDHDYDPNMVIEHLEICQDIMQDTEFIKKESRLCAWCQYHKYCTEGEEIDMLPSINRVSVDTNNYRKIWIYGLPFSGKTYCADTAPTPLNLNTDGNVKYVTMPRLSIKDTMEGRIKKTAWEVFTETVDELSAGSEFKTIVVDLLEDVYDYCRMHVCGKRGWEHESDDSFKAYEICRNEFLRTIRKLMNLPYNIILISHEDTSKDITKRGGDKVTAIKPNIADKVANKIAGMVDIVLRAEKDGDEYTLSSKTNSVIFGGGRLTGLKATDINNSWDAIEDMYKAVSQPKKEVEKVTVTPAEAESLPFAVADVEDVIEVTETVVPEPVEEPKRRTRRKRG